MLFDNIQICLIMQIQVVNCPKDGCFPGLYVTGLLSDPWLSDGHSLMLSTYWRSCRVILSVNLLRWLMN